MKELRFKIFGRHIAVTGEAGAWRAYYFGAEGKRRAADFIIPGDVAEAELCEYLSAEERADIPADVEMFHVEQLEVPELNEKRCLVWLRPQQPAVGAGD